METWSDDSLQHELLHLLGDHIVPGFDAESADAMLDGARDRLRALRNRRRPEDSKWLVTRFLSRIGRIALRSPDHAFSPAVRAFVAESATELRREREALLSYPELLLAELSRGGDWSLFYRRRSALEFFIEMYKGSVLDDVLAELDVQSLDKRMWQHALPVQDVDERMPRTHWWWFA